MNDNKIRNLLGHIRVADTKLDLDDEAKPTADVMFEMLKDDYQLNVLPSKKGHLTAWKDDRGGFEEDPGEDEADRQERRKRWERWPELKTAEQAEWLRCAILASHALVYLQQYEATTQPIGRKFGRFFSPKDFYEYIWICLNQGHGTRVWKTSPNMPADTLLFAQHAFALVQDAVKCWEGGTDLGKIFPVLTLADMLPVPAELSTRSLVEQKLEKAGVEIPAELRIKRPLWLDR